MSSTDQQKYVVCNAVDADPLSRSAAGRLTRNADAVLEGVLSAAQAFGATQAFVCVNAGDDEQAAAVGAALEAALGVALGAAKDPVAIDMVPVAPSLVLEDETALLRVLEGRQAIPHVSVSPPATLSLHGRPATVCGVETLVGLAGGGPGTRMLTVWWQGEARVVEASLDAALGTLVREVTGVEPDAGGVKAVRFGGQGGRFYAVDGLEVPIGFLAEEPCGVVEVLPAGACGVELARDAMSYLSEESCGACAACREGTRQIRDMLDDIAAFRAGAGSLELLHELAEMLEAGSICGLGRRAAGPFRSSVELFLDDYRAHVEGKRCPGQES
jgi:NADH-quinone oxidoreductase subunit F